MEELTGRIMEVTETTAVLEFRNFEVPILADFAISDIIVDNDEKLLAGYIVKVSEKDGKAYFEILGGYWTKEDVERIEKRANELWESIQDIIEK